MTDLDRILRAAGLLGVVVHSSRPGPEHAGLGKSPVSRRTRMWCSMGSPESGRRGEVWVGRIERAGGATDCAALLHEIAHAVVGPSEGSCVAFEVAMAKRAGVSAECVGALIRSQPALAHSVWVDSQARGLERCGILVMSDGRWDLAHCLLGGEK